MNRQPMLGRGVAAIAVVTVVLFSTLACTTDAERSQTGERDTSGSTVESGLRPLATGSVPPTSSTTAPTSTTLPPSTSTAPPAPATSVTPATPSPPSASVSSRDFLAPLVINDRPSPQGAYDRDAWSHWDDTDGDGCDARQQALIAASISPPQVDYYRCQVIAGDWFSAYDGVSTDDPSDFDVDHLVPLANAHQSGGWAWDAPTRRLFANAQVNLWPVSASSNRSKGSRTPDEWRPARTEVWCEFAVRWTTVKVFWGLTATTSERDALGSMLDTCSSLPPPPSGF